MHALASCFHLTLPHPFRLSDFPWTLPLLNPKNYPLLSHRTTAPADISLFWRQAVNVSLFVLRLRAFYHYTTEMIQIFYTLSTLYKSSPLKKERGNA